MPVADDLPGLTECQKAEPGLTRSRSRNWHAAPGGIAEAAVSDRLVIEVLDTELSGAAPRVRVAGSLQALP